MLNFEWLIQGIRFCMDLSINIKSCDEESSIRNNQVNSIYKDVGLSLLVWQVRIYFFFKKN